MKKSKRLTKILDLAVDDENDAARALAESRQQLDTGRAQLDELRALHDEYAELIRVQGENGIHAGKLRHRWAFVNRLATAVSQQLQSVNQSQRLVDSKRDEWTKRRARSRAMAELVDRHRHRERRDEARKLEIDVEDPLNGRRGDSRHKLDNPET